MRRGATQHKPDDKTCMALDCTRTALYMNANSYRGGVRRGYCAKHKEMAASTDAVYREHDMDYLLKRLGVEN